MILLSNCRWLHPILTLGYNKDLNVDDIYRPLPEDNSELLGLKLHRYFQLKHYYFINFSWFSLIFLILSDRQWKIEQEKASRSKRKPSLLKAISATFGLEFVFYGLFIFIEECGAK